MSKTFKRIALVASVALTLGGLTGVSAHAADNAILKFATGDGAAASPYNTGNGVAGLANTVSLTYVQSGSKAAYVTVSGASATIRSGGTVATDALSTALTTGTTVVVNTPAVGTITASVYTETSAGSGIYSTTAAETVTITVNATASAGAYSAAKSTVYMASGETTTVSSTTDAAVTATPIVSAKTASNTAAATIVVTYLDANSNGFADSLTATISGAGNVYGAAGVAAVANSFSGSQVNVYTVTESMTATNKVATFWIFPNGQSGTSTLTVKNLAGTVVATKSITFSDTTVASHTVTVKKAYVKKSADTDLSAVSTSYVIKLSLKDASGYPVASVTPTGVAADTTKISAVTCTASTAGGSSYCGVTAGAVLGKTTITFTTGSGATKVTSTADVTVVSAQAATFTLSADDSVSNGQVITYTLTAKSASGDPIPDGTLVSTYVGSPVISGGANPDYGSLANAGATYNGVAALFTGVKFYNGVATDTVQAPFGSATISADFTQTGTAGVADANFTAALAGVETVVKTTVTGDASTQAALDAAQEATDAANAAYDAANNAMDSADAATAAAQEASDNAAAALAAVTELATTVANLVAKVNSMAATIAKIAKKVKA